MTPEFALTIGHRALELTTTLMLIMLLPALVVGLLVSVFQAATQINEQTLSFIPKLLITMMVLALGGSMMLRLLMDFVKYIFQLIPTIVGG
ncbi:MAG: flagellar biosynthesis protein FliQ [Gammaproteobacteria bacterium]